MNTLDLTENKIKKFGGRGNLCNILAFAPQSPDAIYYVHKVSRITGHMGFFTNKFIVGVDNPADCCKVEDMKKCMEEYHKTRIL